jgi:hypothetical protein
MAAMRRTDLDSSWHHTNLFRRSCGDALRSCSGASWFAEANIDSPAGCHFEAVDNFRGSVVGFFAMPTNGRILMGKFPCQVSG